MQDDLSPFRPISPLGALLESFGEYVDDGLDGTQLQTKADGKVVGVPLAITFSHPVDEISAVAQLSAYRHAYYAVDLDEEGSSEGPTEEQVVARKEDRTDDLTKATLFSSELVGDDGQLTGYHTIALDIDLPVRVRKTSTPGHHHLFIDRPLTWDQYRKLIDVLVELDIVEPGFAAASLAREATHVRLPWIHKDITHHPTTGEPTYRRDGEIVTEEEYRDEVKRQAEDARLHAIREAAGTRTGDGFVPDFSQHTTEVVDGQTVYRKPRDS